MSKRSKLKGKSRPRQLHPTQSFADLVGQKNTEALKPYIDQQMNLLGQALAKNQLAGQAPVVTRLSVLEDLIKKNFNLSDQQLYKFYLDKEDEAWGLAESSEPAKKGDFVRADILVQDKDEKFVSVESEIKFRNLTDPYSLVEHMQPLEDAILGMNAGEEKVVAIKMPATQEDAAPTNYKVIVDRISVKKEEDKDE